VGFLKSKGLCINASLHLASLSLCRELFLVKFLYFDTDFVAKNLYS